MKTSATCPVCKQLISTTHPMQTIKKQMDNHLRTHGLKGQELRRIRIESGATTY